MIDASRSEIASMGFSARRVEQELIANTWIESAGGALSVFRHLRRCADPDGAAAVADAPSQPQGEPDPNCRPSWGTPLAESMVIEYRTNGSLGLLTRFGIPLTAAILIKAYPEARVVKGVAAKLAELVESRDLDAVCRIARQSIVASPYVDGFPLLDWRERFAEIWDTVGCRSQAWWRDGDYAGKAYIEYDGLIASEASNARDGAAAAAR